MQVSSLLMEPYAIHDVPKAEQYSVPELLQMVELPKRLADYYPHELSGGQARRVGIARALSLRPRLIVADEPTAGLDVSASSAILNLLQSLRGQYGTAYMIITHALNIVGYLADRIAVMYLGRLVETGPAERFTTPLFTPTRGRSSRRSRRWIRATPSGRLSSQARSRARETPPPAATSTLVAPLPSPSAAPSTPCWRKPARAAGWPATSGRRSPPPPRRLRGEPPRERTTEPPCESRPPPGSGVVAPCETAAYHPLIEQKQRRDLVVPDRVRPAEGAARARIRAAGQGSRRMDDG